MAQLMQNIAAIWKHLGVNQKVSLAIFMMVLAAGFVALAMVSRRQVYDVLYADLGDKDMAKVVSHLDDEGVPHRFSNGGRTIMVPRERKYAMRLEVADKGLVSGGVAGLELWDGPGWGASHMAEQMWKRRTIQGELARTIMHIQQVEWADVQVAQPEPSLFVNEEKPVTAAITVRTSSGQSLSSPQVAGICRLVACSVEGLRHENITVIDERGNLLTKQRQGSQAILAAADAQDQQRSVEIHLTQKAQTMLDRVLGPGKSIVKVSATLDLEAVSETTTDYNAEKKVARTEEIVSRTTKGSGNSGGGGKSEEIAKTDYDVPKTIRTSRKTPGKISHLAVAVIIDPTIIDSEGEEATRATDEIDALANSVKRAVGWVEGGKGAERSDTFEIATLRFHAPTTAAASEEAIAGGKTREFALQMARHGLPVLAVVIFLIFARVMLKKAGGLAPVSAVAGGAATMGGGAAGAVQLPAGASPVATTTLMPERDEEFELLRKHVRDMVTEDAQKTARIMQAWLSETI